MNLHGTIGLICLCIVLCIFFPPLILLVVVVWVLNLVCKASEAHDAMQARREEMPKVAEPIARPFIADQVGDIF